MYNSGSGELLSFHPFPTLPSSRTEKFVDPVMEGSCYCPLPLQGVGNEPLLQTESLSTREPTCKPKRCSGSQKSCEPLTSPRWRVSDPFCSYLPISQTDHMLSLGTRSNFSLVGNADNLRGFLLQLPTSSQWDTTCGQTFPSHEERGGSCKFFLSRHFCGIPVQERQLPLNWYFKE